MDHMHMKNGSMHMDMTMQMTFFASSHVTLFFDGWVTSTVGEMLGSCVAMVVLGILYEGFKKMRLKVKRKLLHINSPSRSGYGAIGGLEKESSVRVRGQSKVGARMINAFLHVVQLFIGYLLMLAFMTYNAWICISVLIGAFIGFVIFEDDNDTSGSMGDHCNM